MIEQKIEEEVGDYYDLRKDIDERRDSEFEIPQALMLMVKKQTWIKTNCYCCALNSCLLLSKIKCI